MLKVPNNDNPPSEMDGLKPWPNALVAQIPYPETLNSFMERFSLSRDELYEMAEKFQKKKAKKVRLRDADGVLLTDCWETPQGSYEAICKQFNFMPQIDACANSENTKCPKFFTLAIKSALEVDWCREAEIWGLKPYFWMNPPYSQQLLGKFVAKAYEESQRGASVLCLLPNSRDTKWYKKYVKPIAKTPYVEDGDGRIRFIPPRDGDGNDLLKAGSPCGGNMFVLFVPPEIR